MTRPARRYPWLGWLVAILMIGLTISFWGPRRPIAASQIGRPLSTGDGLGNLPGESSPLPQLIAQPSETPIYAESSILVDADTGTVLYAERPNEALPIASTTKLMTALIVRQHLSLDQVVTVTAADATTEGTTINLRPNETITVESLLYGMLLNSGNDAAVSLAHAVVQSSDTAAFVALMNDEANTLGLTHTHYLDPAGLDDDGHSSARDLAVVARAILRDPVLSTIVQTQQKVITSADGRIVHPLKNANHLIGDMHYAGVIGFKTGFTPAAGHCLVAGAERNNHRLIAVILRTNVSSITASAIEARKLLDWGWQNTIWQVPRSTNNPA